MTGAIRFKPDIVHAHTQFMMGYSAWMAAKRLGVPLVGHVPHARRRVRDVRGEALEDEPASAQEDREGVPGLFLQAV